MTDKTTVADDEGPGVRATRAVNRRWRVYQLVYVVIASALTVGLIMGRRDPAAGFPPFTPEAGVAGAILLPLLTLVTMWFVLRMVDEVQRRIIVDAWAVGFIVTIFAAISWAFLIGGGVLLEPPGTAALVSLAGIGAVTVLVSGIWLRWRRIGTIGAM